MKSRAVGPVTHGLYVRAANARGRRDLRVRRLVYRMRCAMPWIEDADVPACRGWAELEILSSTVFAEIKRVGVIGKDDEPRRLLGDYRQLRLAQLAYERELGMTPASRQALRASGNKPALDLVAAFARTDEGEESDGKKEEPN